MKTFSFDYAVRPFEIPREGRVYKRQGRNSYEYTVVNDAERAFIFLKPTTDQEKWCKNLYKYITKKIMLETTVEYYQGMCEVSSYFVLFYFKESASEKYKKIVEELNRDDFSSAGSENIEHDTDNMLQFIDEEIYEKCSVVVTNVLQEKYIPLVENDFVIYNRYNHVFMKMMEKRGVRLAPEVCGSYMNTTLSWFSRSIENIDDIYKIFAILISCPTSMSFLMLVYYFKIIESGSKIKNVDGNLYKHLVALEHEFLRIENQVDNPPLIPRKRLVIGAAALGVVLAVVIYQLSKKDK
eukprot:jgi/Antlo1/1874/1552